MSGYDAQWQILLGIGSVESDELWIVESDSREAAVNLMHSFLILVHTIGWARRKKERGEKEREREREREILNLQY